MILSRRSNRGFCEENMSDESQYVQITSDIDAPIILGEGPNDSFVHDFAMGDGDIGGDYVGGDYMVADFSSDLNYLGDTSSIPMLQVDNNKDEEEDEPILVGEEIVVVSKGPTPMEKWNEEFQSLLAERKEQENSVKSLIVENARFELQKFQDEREKKRLAKMAKNREDEQSKLEAMEADLANDNSWQKVCKFVDLSHDGKTGDVQRSIDILILLKNDEARAKALSA